MIIVYRKDTLAVEHCVHVAADAFTQMIDEDPDRGWLRVEGTFRPDEIAVATKNGQPSFVLRKEFPITMESSPVVGGVATFLKVPKDTMINTDAGLVIMNTTGKLDVEFETVGTYRVSFSHPLYRFKEYEFEVTA